MRRRDGTRELALVTAVAFFAALPACDRIDVTSSVEPPSARCASCHLPEYLGADHPLHRGVKPTTCGSCHSESSFHPFRLTHSFPLQGAHAKADCFACHTGSTPIFEGTPKRCALCHAADHERANQRVAKHESFGEDCAHCHGTAQWKPTLEGRAVEGSVAPVAPLRPAEPVGTSRPGSTVSRRAAPAQMPTATPKPEPPSPNGGRKRPDSVSSASPAWKRAY